MVKTNRMLNIAVLVLFAALLAYLGFAVFHRTQNAYTTAQCVLVTVNETGEAQGVVVREETVLRSDRAYISISVDEGREVAKGGEVAVAVDSQTALEDAARVRQLDAEIDYVRSLLSNVDRAAGALERDSAVHTAVYRLASAVSNRNAAQLDSACVSLSSLLFTGGASVSQGDLDALMAQRRQLNTAGAEGSITAPAAGVYTGVVDGYEALTPDMLENLTPAGVRALVNEKSDVPDDAIGKLITAKKWYYAAVLSEEDAARLSINTERMLDFGRHSAGAVSAIVRSISEPVDGEVAVVFAINRDLAETVGLRETPADVVYESHTGLRVPLKAVHFDGDQTVVYVITAGHVEMKAVNILYQTDDYVLIERGAEKDALRAGNEVVVDGKGLEDGKSAVK